MLYKVFLIYLLVINVAGFVMMGWDKGKARKDQWRVPERNFFMIALLGGSLGCWLGMQKFHHKTKHPAFVVGIPVIFILQAILALILYGKFFWVR